MIKPQIYSYLEGFDQMKKAWNALSTAFSDSATSRKVFILQQFTSTKYNDCSSMENYVNTMTSLYAKVKSVGFAIGEEVAASLLLAGLPSTYQPMIFSLENSTTTLTMDYVKNILLQGAISKDDSADGALFSKGKHFSKKKKQIKCYNCGGPHFARKCKLPRKNNKFNEKNDASANLFSAFMSNNSNSWSFDSGATFHMCNNEAIFNNKRDPVKKSITTANGEKMNVEYTGDVMQSVNTMHGTNELLIKNVQYLPNLCVNFLSIPQIVKGDNTVVFTKNGWTVYNKKEGHCYWIYEKRPFQIEHKLRCGVKCDK